MAPDIRTRILDAAVHLLETEGAKAFGQVRVARAAGVKQGNITYHFPKKSDLVAAVVERVNEHRGAELDALLARARELAPADLRALLFERLSAMAVEQNRSRVMLALLVEAQDDPAISALLSSITRSQRAMVTELLRRTPGDLELELVFATISGLSLYALSGSQAVAALLERFRAWLPILLPVAGEAATGKPRKAPPRRRAAPRAAGSRKPRR